MNFSTFSLTVFVATLIVAAGLDTAGVSPAPRFILAELAGGAIAALLGALSWPLDRPSWDLWAMVEDALLAGAIGLAPAFIAALIGATF